MAQLRNVKFGSLLTSVTMNFP